IVNINTPKTSKNIEVPAAPYNRLFGHLKLSELPGAEFPITIKLLDTVLPTSRLNPASHSVPNNYVWGTSLNTYGSESPIGNIFSIRSVQVALADKNTPWPVLSQDKFVDQSSLGFENYMPVAQSLLLEISGKSGRPLLRRWLIPVYGLNGNVNFNG